MHWILILPDIQPARYPANPKAGYRTSGKGRIPDIRPDTGYPAGYRISGRIVGLTIFISSKISNKFLNKQSFLSRKKNIFLSLKKLQYTGNKTSFLELIVEKF
jgi:hypothetical protein